MSRNGIFLLVVPVALGLGACSSAVYKQDGLLAQTTHKTGLINTQVTPDEEAQIGRDSAATLLGAAPLLNDPRLQNYVNKVGGWVAQNSETPGRTWQFGVLDSDAINAFAAPSGYVLITRGLVAVLNNEAELAGVLAHEIAHVQQQHHLRQIVQQRISKALTGELLNTTADTIAQQPFSRTLIGDTGNQALKFSTNTVTGMVRFFTTDLYSNGLARSDELDADRLGVVLAARAGYDPFGLPAALQTLDSLNPDDPVLSLLFKTHPRPQERLQALESFMVTLPEDDTPTLGAERFRKQADRYRR